LKIVSKIPANRLRKVLGNIIEDHQSGFLKGRSTFDSVGTTQEVIQFAKRNKVPGFMLKPDFEKASDMVEWDCILGALHSWEFSSIWTSWIRLWLQSAKVMVLVNVNQGREIAYKSLRQWNPLSPLIFVLVVEELHRMIDICRVCLIKGLGCWDEENVVVNLHYVEILSFFKRKIYHMQC